jgi:hypothetical protein
MLKIPTGELNMLNSLMAICLLIATGSLFASGFDVVVTEEDFEEERI